MKAVRLVKAGTRAITELRDEQLPSPGKHEVLIRIHAVSLNYRDIAVLRGEYPAKVKEDVIPISDGAGEVMEIGPGVSQVKPGDRIAVSCCTTWIGGPFVPEYYTGSVGFGTDGLLAEYVTVNEQALVRIPDYMSYAEAASLPCAAVTAWTALNKIKPLQPGQTVLVQGTGGFSVFATQVSAISQIDKDPSQSHFLNDNSSLPRLEVPTSLQQPPAPPKLICCGVLEWTMLSITARHQHGE